MYEARGPSPGTPGESVWSPLPPGEGAREPLPEYREREKDGTMSLILAKHDQPTPQEAAFERAFISVCRAKGMELLVVPHLYQVDDHSTLWQELARRAMAAALLSCLHPRPMRWLLQQHAVDAGQMIVLSLR